MNVQELIAAHRIATTEKEKAELETQIWNLATHEERKLNPHRYKHLFTLMPEDSTYHYQMRGRLIQAGAAADPLWERVEKDLLMKTADNILASSKKLDLPLDQAILQELATYDALPYVRTMKDGKSFRTKGISNGRPKTTVIPPDLPKAQGNGVWKLIREELGKKFVAMTEGLHPAMQQELNNQFETDVKILIETYQTKIYRLRKDTPVVKITQYKINKACEVLNLPNPSVNKKVDLSLAKKMKNKLASVYHPDKYTDPVIKQSMSSRFQEIMEAFAVVENYNESIK